MLGGCWMRSRSSAGGRDQFPWGRSTGSALGPRGSRRTVFGDPAFRSALIEVLADRDESLLSAYVENESRAHGPTPAPGARHPDPAVAGPPGLLRLGDDRGGRGGADGRPGRTAAGRGRRRPDAERRGRVFKIDRGPAGEKIAYVRMFAGTVHVRQRLHITTASGGNAEAKATAISVSDKGTWVRRRRRSPPARSARLWGLSDVRIGDTIGELASRSTGHSGELASRPPRHRGELASRPGWQFGPPTMQTVVAPVRPSDDVALRVALARLAEQDPLINVRADDTGREISVSLYGEVQKEVLQATLAAEFGIDVAFRDTTTICVERPVHASARRLSFSTPTPTRSRPPSACGSSRARPTPGSSSGCGSSRRQRRCTSTRVPTPSRTTWASTCARHCARVVSVGR